MAVNKSLSPLYGCRMGTFSVSNLCTELSFLLLINACMYNVKACFRRLYGIYCLSPRAKPEGKGNISSAAQGKACFNYFKAYYCQQYTVQAQLTDITDYHGVPVYNSVRVILLGTTVTGTVSVYSINVYANQILSCMYWNELVENIL